MGWCSKKEQLMFMSERYFCLGTLFNAKCRCMMYRKGRLKESKENFMFKLFLSYLKNVNHFSCIYIQTQFFTFQ